MRSLIARLFFVFGFAVSTVHAETIISLDSTTVSPGDTAKFNFKLANSVEIGGFQFVITPTPAENITFSEVRAIGRAAGWTVSYNARGNGQIFIVYSSVGATISSGTDSILTFEFIISADAPEEKIDLQLSEVLLSDSNLNLITDLTVANGRITIEEILPENIEPIASFTYYPQSGTQPLAVNFDAFASNDPDGSISAYQWDFGDGATGSGTPISHTYQGIGTFTITLTVTDNEGTTNSLTRDVLIYQSGEYQRGDINRDGKTDIFDLLELIGILSGTKPN